MNRQPHLVRHPASGWRLLCAVAASVWALGAQAHQIWLEQPPTGSGAARLFFGEFVAGMRESSPGYLDSFGQLKAHRQAAGRLEPTTLATRPGDLALPLRAARGESLLAEDARYPLMDGEDGGRKIRTWYHPAARLITDWSPQAPQLRLDIVPTGRQDSSGQELKVVFDGRPLAEAKVVVATPAGWSRELGTGADGTVRVALPWKGRYVIEVVHPVEGGGQRDAERYDRAEHVTTLSVWQATGLTPPPPLAAAKGY